jgi:hypothetical protein
MYATSVVARRATATIAEGITVVGIIVMATYDPGAAAAPHYLGGHSRKYLAMASDPLRHDALAIKRNAIK